MVADVAPLASTLLAATDFTSKPNMSTSAGVRAVLSTPREEFPESKKLLAGTTASLNGTLLSCIWSPVRLRSPS